MWQHFQTNEILSEGYLFNYEFRNVESKPSPWIHVLNSDDLKSKVNLLVDHVGTVPDDRILHERVGVKIMMGK